MNSIYNRAVDAIYVRLRHIPYAFGDILEGGRRIDYGADHLPVGIELLDVSRGVVLDGLPERDEVARVLREYAVPIAA